ncbi:MAG: DUF1552 domain-containing protein [Myxococcota bacterium]
MKDMNETVNRSRRDFLGLLSKAGVSAAMYRAAPLVGGLMATRSAHAQGNVKRAIFVYTPDGSPNGLWLPNGTTLNASTLAYEGLQNICNFREVDVVASGHGNARKALGALRWGQDWTGDTIDQQIASVISATMPYESVQLGVWTNINDTVSRKSGDRIAFQTSPAAAYEQLFSGPPPGNDGAAFLARKRSVMDVNKAALDALKGRLGTFERQLLDKHETALQRVEQRLVDSVSFEPAEGCASPAWNAGGYPQTNGESNYPFLHTAELHSDVIVAAMQCGLTNSVTLQLGWHQAEWTAHNTNYKGTHHNSCHSSSNPADNAEMTNYLSQCIAYLINRLVEEEDPAVPGTRLIDNTVVVQVTDMGDGTDHSGGNGPNMVATRMPTFKQGTVTQGGNNLQVLEAVVEGLGLSAFKGTDVNAHRIWPCADGQIAGAILA